MWRLISTLIAALLPLTGSGQQLIWDEVRERQHLLNREDSTTWDARLLRQDLQRNQERESRPMAYGAFPVPRYELLGDEAFKGVGNGGNFTGIDWEGRKILYSYFLVNRNAFNAAWLGDKPNEVFFTIIVLSDFVDTVNFSHAGLHIVSRNNPDFIGQGYFKTTQGPIDYMAFLTADRQGFAIVNMRLFNLKHGRTILIVPLRDGSLRSMQIKSGILSDEEVEGHVAELLSREEVRKFFAAVRQ